MKVLICICLCFLIAVVQCHPKYRDSQEDSDSKNVLRKLMKDLDIQKLLEVDALDRGKLLQATDTGCSCVRLNCGCCLHVSWEKLKIDNSVCVNLTYLPAPEYGISLTLSLDDKVLINETVSAKNPPPICADVPELKNIASICLKFSNMSFGDRTLSGCLALEGRIYKIFKEEVKLGCFKIPPGNHSNTVLKVPSYRVQSISAKAKSRQRQDAPYFVRPSNDLRQRSLE